MVLAGGSRLMMVAPVEATRSLLKIRVHYPGYFESLALKHRHSRRTVGRRLETTTSTGNCPLPRDRRKFAVEHTRLVGAIY